MKEIEVTEGFAEVTTQHRFALVNYRTLVDKGHPEYMKDVKRLEQELKERLESVGGIDKFNEYVDRHNVELHAERARMRPIEDWP